MILLYNTFNSIFMKQITYWWFLIVILFLLSAYLHSKDLIREGNKGDVLYEPDDLDIEYHISIDDLIEQDQIRGVTRVVDSDGNLIDLNGNFEKTPIYYQPEDKHKYSLVNYIPDYEDTMYLSKTHGVLTQQKVNNNDTVETDDEPEADAEETPDLTDYNPYYEDNMYLTKPYDVFIRDGNRVEIERGVETELKQKYGKDVTTLMSERVEQREQNDLENA